MKFLAALLIAILNFWPCKAQQLPADSLVRYYVNLKKSGKPEDQDKIKLGIQKLADQDEKGILLATRIAAAVKENIVADSLHRLTISRYPRGITAMMSGYRNLAASNVTATEKEKEYEKFLQAFPEPDAGSDIVYDYARSEVARAYALEANGKQNRVWIDKIRDKGIINLLENGHAWILLSKGDTLSAQALVSTAVKNAALGLQKDENPDTRKSYLRSLMNLAKFQYKLQQNGQAMENITKVYAKSEEKSPQLLDLYALILTANGRGKEALPLFEDIFSDGKQSKEDMEAVRTAYNQARGSGSGFDSFMADAAEKASVSLRNATVKLMVDEPSPDFTLLDLDGKSVSMAGLKGKVIVLDFWATWCGPCKKSFPAMQKAVVKYQKDPQVRFLFIDTWERIPDPKKEAAAFIAQNNYSFQVLLDDRKSNVVEMFGVKGIPAKFVIDGSGRIRFKLTGFNGAEEAAVQEISAMIDLAKKQK